MPNEADRKRELVKAVKALGGMRVGWRTVGRSASSTWSIKLPGRSLIWAEGKIIKGNLFGPTPAQFDEGKVDQGWRRCCADRLARQGDVYFAVGQKSRQTDSAGRQRD